MIIVLLGAPGSGKGTFASLLSKDFKIPQISTGDLIRNEIAKNSKLGKIFKERIDNGNFISNEEILKLLKKRISEEDCQNGYILDGFPRNVEQAETLKKLTNIDYVFGISTPIDIVLKRLASRKICAKCNKVYNTEIYKNNKCEKCGGNLITREDDSPKIIKKRFEIYNKETKPLIDYYKDKLIIIENKSELVDSYKKVKNFLKKEGKKIGCEIAH